MSKILRGNSGDVTEYNACYNTSQRCALFVVYFDKEFCMFVTDPCPSSGGSTLYTAIHDNYIDCLLARAACNIMSAI
jgi:hypothetical protein